MVRKVDAFELDGMPASLTAPTTFVRKGAPLPSTLTGGGDRESAEAEADLDAVLASAGHSQASTTSRGPGGRAELRMAIAPGRTLRNSRGVRKGDRLDSVAAAKLWSGRWESNPRHSAWEADVLPLNYARAPAWFSGGVRACPRLPRQIGASLNGRSRTRCWRRVSSARVGARLRPEALQARSGQPVWRAAYVSDVPSAGRGGRRGCRREARSPTDQPAFAAPAAGSSAWCRHRHARARYRGGPEGPRRSSPRG